jgi:hypothetical protein
MQVIAKIRRDVNYEFKANATAKLDKSARSALGEIFKITIGAFATRATRITPPVDVWQRPKLRSFILLAVRQIAKEASKNASNGVITKKVLNQAAAKIMTRLHNGFCTLKIKNGRLEDLRPGHYSDYSAGQSDGEVCTTFLEGRII